MSIVGVSDYLVPTEWSGGDWTALTFFVLVIAALYARRQVLEARRLREEQARPFVVIDFHAWHSIIELTITNVGKTLARDVQFEFDPPLATTHDETRGTGPLKDLNVFKKGIPSLAPGKTIRLFFDQFPVRIEKQLPMTYEARVMYQDPTGRRYSDPTVLDLEMYLGTGGITRYDVHDIHNRLKEVADALKRWTDFDGLKVLTRGDLKERREEIDAYYAELDAAAQEANGGENAADESPGLG